jgi:hypothetical protein
MSSSTFGERNSVVGDREEGAAEARRLFKHFMQWVPFGVRSKA